MQSTAQALLANLPQTLRSALNCHRYIVFGKSFRSFTTNKKEVDSIVASILGQWGVTGFRGLAQRLVALGLVAGMMASGGAWAIPNAGNTTFYRGAGSVTNPDANTANININSVRAILDSTDHNTFAGQTINYIYSQANSTSLTRITGGPTLFFGNLNVVGGGTPILVNEGGFLFGPGSSFNVPGIVASTLPMSTDPLDFTNPAIIEFTFNVPAAGDVALVNQGTINADDFAILISKGIVNAGSIQSNGQVHLAVGDTVTMSMPGGVLVDVTVDTALSSAITTFTEAITNGGVINANKVELKAKLQNAVYTRAINNTGQIEATKVSGVDGQIVFEATGAGLQNTNLIVSDGNVLASADSIDNLATGTIRSTKGNVTLNAGTSATETAGQDIVNDGTVQAAKGTVAIDAGDDVTNTGTIDGQTVTIAAADDITNTGAAALIKAKNNITLTSVSKNVKNTGSTIQSTNGDITIAAGDVNTLQEGRDLDNTGSILATKGTITVNVGDDIDNESGGSINGKFVNATAADNIRNKAGSSITAKETLTLTSQTEDIINDGTLGSTSLKTANLTADHDIKGTGQTNGKTVNLATTNGNIGDAVQAVAVDANTLTVNTGGNAFVSDVDGVDLGASNATDDLNVSSQGAGELEVTGAVTGKTVTLANLDGDVKVSNTVDAEAVTVNAERHVNVNANVNTTDGRLTILADSDNDGTGNATLAAGTTHSVKKAADIDGVNVTVNATSLSAKNVDIDADNKVTVAAGSQLTGRRSVKIDAKTVDNNGTIIANKKNLEITTTTGLLRNDGTLRANKANVLLTSTTGSDINNQGTVQATEGLVSINANDDFTNGATANVTGESVSIQTVGEVANSGGITATVNGIQIDTEGSKVTNSGTMTSADNISVNAGSSATPAPGGDIVNSGTMMATNNVVFDAADDVTNNGGVTSTAGSVFIDAADAYKSGAASTVTGNQGVTITANTVDSDGAITAQNNNATVNTTGNLQNDGTIMANVGDIALTSTTGNVTNNGNLLANAGNVDLNALAGSVNTGAFSFIFANNAVDIDANTVDNDGFINTLTGDIDIDTVGNLKNDGTIASGLGRVSLVSTDGDVNNTNSVNAGKRARLIAGNTVKNSGLVSGRNVVLRAKNNVENNGGVVSAINDVTLKSTNAVNFQEGDDIINSGQVTAGNQIIVQANDDFNNQAGGVMTANSIAITTGDDVTNNGNITSLVGDVQIDATGSKVTNAGTINSANDLNINAGDSAVFQDGDDIVNTATGQLLARKAINLNAGDDITNNGVVRGRNVTVTAADSITTGDDSKLIGRQGLTVTGEQITNNGKMIARHNNMDVTATQGNLNNNGLVRAQDGRVNLTADQGNVSNQGTIEATRRARLLANQGNVTNGGDITGKNVVLNAQGTINNQADASISAERTITVKTGNGNRFTAGRTVTNNGVMTAGNEINVTANDDININGGRLAADDVSLKAGDNITINGEVEGIRQEILVVDKVAMDGFPPADSGTVTLDAANNITVGNEGRVTAGQQVDGTAGNNVTVNGSVEATGGRGGILPIAIGRDEAPAVPLAEGLFGEGLFDGPLLNGDVALVAIDGDIKTGEVGQVKAKGNVLGIAGDDIINNGRISARRGDIFLGAPDKITNNGSIVARRGTAFLTTAEGNIVNSETGRIAAGEQITVDAGDDIVNDGTITGLGEGRRRGPRVFRAAERPVLSDNLDADVKLIAENDIRGNGLTRGDKVVLKAKNGNIGSEEAAFNTEANKLKITAKNGSAFINELDGVKLRKSTVLNTLEVTSQNDGDIKVKGEITGDDVSITNNAGDIVVDNTILGSTNVSLTALDGNLSGDSLVSGETMVLTASDNIGLNTNASFLTGSAGGDMTLRDSNSVIIDSLIAGGALNFSNGNEFPGIFDPLAGSGSVLAGLFQGNTVNVNVNGNLLDGNGAGLNLIANGNSTLLAGGVIGTLGDPFDVFVNGNLGVGANGQIAGTSIVINGTVNPSNTLSLLNTPPGAVLFNGNFLALGPLVDALLRQGQPALVGDYNRLRELFNNTVNTVDSVIDDGITTGVEARITDERSTIGQPFDLRLIEEDEEGGFSFVAIED